MPTATPSLRACSLRALRGAGMAFAIVGLAAACLETLSFGHEHMVGGHALHHSHFFLGAHEHHDHDSDSDHDHDHDHDHGAPPHHPGHPPPEVTTSTVPAMFQPAVAGELSAPAVGSTLLGTTLTPSALLPPAARPALPRGPPPPPASPSFSI